MEGRGEQGNRVVVAVIAALLAALVAGAVVADGGSEGEEGSRPQARERPADVAPIARRVEAIRELRFRRLPAPRVVAPAQVRREGLTELDRRYPEARRRADEELLKLVGLLGPADDLRSAAGSIFGEQVAGFYDVRRKRLALVRGVSARGAIGEITLAHELVHALEDQRFGLRDPGGLAVQDRATAYAALLEGTATTVMTQYARRHLSPVSALGELGEALAGAEGVEKLPPYLQASLLFPYLRGAQFVSALLDKGGWGLVDAAFDRPPASTEQVLHPERYLRVEPPERLALRAGALLGRGWRRVSAGQVGEFDTVQLLRGGESAAVAEAAEGWGGGAYELWRSGPLPAPGCAAPCRARDALVLAWSWDTPRDARQFEAALPALARRVRARPAGSARYTVTGGALAVVARARTTTVALAPSARVATLLASRALARVSRPTRFRP